MALLKQIQSRRAYRTLDTKPIAREILLRLLEAAHLAPSYSNNQPWRIVTVVEPARLEALKASLTPGQLLGQESARDQRLCHPARLGCAS